MLLWILNLDFAAGSDTTAVVPEQIYSLGSHTNIDIQSMPSLGNS